MGVAYLMGHQPRARYLTTAELPWWWPPAWVDDAHGWNDAAREVAACLGESLPRDATQWRVMTGRYGDRVIPPPPTSPPV